MKDEATYNCDSCGEEIVVPNAVEGLLVSLARKPALNWLDLLFSKECPVSVW
jgi:hypothetical protein